MTPLITFLIAVAGFLLFKLEKNERIRQLGYRVFLTGITLTILALTGHSLDLIP